MKGRRFSRIKDSKWFCVHKQRAFNDDKVADKSPSISWCRASESSTPECITIGQGIPTKLKDNRELHLDNRMHSADAARVSASKVDHFSRHAIAS